MDPFLWRTLSYVAVFVGTGLVLAGSIGTWYFGNLAERAAPFRAAIRSASCTVEIVIATQEPYDNFFMDRGGYLALGRGSTAIMTTSASQSNAKQVGDGRAVFRAVFQMDASDPAVGRPVHELREAEFLQIEFLQMPRDAHVLEGKAVLTINSTVRLEISIPEQNLTDGKIFVRQIADAFRDFQ